MVTPRSELRPVFDFRRKKGGFTTVPQFSFNVMLVVEIVEMLA
jgi:hypothetical protein